MTSSRQAVQPRQVPFELKGSLFTLTVLQLWQSDPASIERHLRSKVEQAPGFFQHVPVIIDLAELNGDVDFIELAALLRRYQLIPVGVRHASVDQQAACLQAGLPVLPEQRSTGRNSVEPEPETPPPTRNRLHQQPVRSGQQIYAPDGDLIIIGTVSVGAEVLADGNIHIYGPLRGRALAGVRGDTRARIFCASLEAQLVSIAGNYRILEKPDEVAGMHQAVQIHLDDDRLIIEPLTRST